MASSPLEISNQNSELLAELYETREKARASRLEWERYEKATAARIMSLLGYSNGKTVGVPVGRTVVFNGKPVFSVEVSTRIDIDRDYLKENYPAIWAECEKTIYVKTIRPPD
jgi:hypothetical protein